MQLLPVDSDGYYIGRVIDHTVLENEETGSIQLGCQIALDYSYDDTSQEWSDIKDQEFYVGGYFTLRTSSQKGGKPMEKTVNVMAQVFGWTSGEVEELQMMDLSGKNVMVDVKTSVNINSGNPQIRAEWLMVPAKNPQRGGLAKMDEAKLQALSTRRASEFRAVMKPVPTTPIFDPAAATPDNVPF